MSSDMNPILIFCEASDGIAVTAHIVQLFQTVACELQKRKRDEIDARAAELCKEATQTIGEARQDIFDRAIKEIVQGAQTKFDRRWREKFDRRWWHHFRNEEKLQLEAMTEFAEMNTSLEQKRTDMQTIAQREIDQKAAEAHGWIKEALDHEYVEFDHHSDKSISEASDILLQIPVKQVQAKAGELYSQFEIDLRSLVTQTNERMERQARARIQAIAASFETQSNL